MSTKTPLVVDLDGSLIRTDMLYESFLRVVFSRPYLIFLMPIWLARGIPHLKRMLSQYSSIDVSVLPYNRELLSYLNAEKAAGRRLILCTASYQDLAIQVADYLQLFESVYATQDHNLSGSQKAELLVAQYGEKGFSYAANESVDLKVWKHAASAVAIDLRSPVRRGLELICDIEHSIHQNPAGYKTYLNAMRIHQWGKNLLLFVPAVAAQQFFDSSVFFSTLLAFLSFGLCASATYLINDMSDLDHDRRHWRKQNRPLASGALSIRNGLYFSAVLLFVAFVIATLVSFWFVAILGIYLLLTLCYSLVLKRLQTVDIVALAALYTIRLFAGGAASDIMPTFWLLSFSMFVFLSLAIIKRISEIIKKSKADAVDRISGRGYYVSDLEILRSLGAASGMVSILVFAMYIDSKEVIELYTRPHILWFVCPIFGYWMIRMLIMASRGEVDEDPIMFAIKDSKSLMVGGILLMVLGFAG